jgi:D-tyrosyl-tRNA(Tyr) deacylase
MIALVQRVSRARVLVDGGVTGAIGHGLLVLLGIHADDSLNELAWVARKCANLRVFPDEHGRMNRSVREEDGDVLVVSQFTLYGDMRKGNRPSYNAAAQPEVARPIFDRFVEALEAEIGRPVPTGVFGALMDVELVNHGPVTVWIEKPPAGAGQISSAPS